MQPSATEIKYRITKKHTPDCRDLLRLTSAQKLQREHYSKAVCFRKCNQKNLWCCLVIVFLFVCFCIPPLFLLAWQSVLRGKAAFMNHLKIELIYFPAYFLLSVLFLSCLFWYFVLKAIQSLIIDDSVPLVGQLQVWVFDSLIHLYFLPTFRFSNRWQSLKISTLICS